MAKITDDMSVMMAINLFMTYVRKNHVSESDWDELLLLCSNFIEGSKRYLWSKTKSQLSKYLDLYKISNAKKRYVPKTQKQEKFNPHYVINEISEVLQMNFDQKEFCELLLDGIKRQSSAIEEEYLNGIIDGRIHQELQESGYFNVPNNLTGTMFIDGVSLFDHGEESFVNCFIVINQLRREHRHLLRFTMPIGIFPTSCGKKNFDKFLIDIITLLNQAFEVGCVIIINNRKYVVRLLITAIILDLKEKANIMRMKSAGDFWSCYLCYLRGDVIDKKVYYIPKGNGVEPRSAQSILIDQFLADKHVGHNNINAFRGIKGVSLLSSLKGLDLL